MSSHVGPPWTNIITGKGGPFPDPASGVPGELTVLAGRGCGTLDPGRYVKYAEGTPMTNLWLSLMDRMETKVERHGDSTGRLEAIA